MVPQKSSSSTSVSREALFDCEFYTTSIHKGCFCIRVVASDRESAGARFECKKGAVCVSRGELRDLGADLPLLGRGEVEVPAQARLQVPDALLPILVDLRPADLEICPLASPGAVALGADEIGSSGSRDLQVDDHLLPCELGERSALGDHRFQDDPAGLLSPELDDELAVVHEATDRSGVGGGVRGAEHGRVVEHSLILLG